jgi:prepilin-type N-terminal cleavage/methylation domain-containing protein
MDTVRNKQSGFSLIELITAMALSVLILGVGVATFSGALNTRSRQTSETDAITSAQAALNIMSREVGNSGYGLNTNGLVLADCDGKHLHFRANTANASGSAATDSAGEDVMFYYDSVSQSVVRYDKVAGTSGVINRVSNVDFVYYNYTFNTVTGQVDVVTGSPALNTARVNIKLTVLLANVTGQPTNRTVTLSSDVTLRNSPFMLAQY